MFNKPSKIVLCGVVEIRTRVQGDNQRAFYMLSRSLIFVDRLVDGKPTYPLSAIISLELRR